MSWKNESQRHAMSAKGIKTIDITKPMTARQERQYQNDMQRVVNLGITVQKLEEALRHLDESTHGTTKTHIRIENAIEDSIILYNQERKKIETKYIQGMFKVRK